MELRTPSSFRWALGGVLAACLAGGAAWGQTITPSNPGAADLQFTVSSAAGSRAISPYIYGVNFYGSSGFSNPATLDRLGGNRWTGYNWETNYSNAGADYYHHNDNFLVNGVSNTPPGEAVRPSLVAANNANRALIVTVPMAGYVSADANGTVDETQVAPSARWKEVRAKKTSVPAYADPVAHPLSLTPNEADNYVFTDEFVNWVEQTRNPNQKVFYSLDNEPALWGEALPAGWQSGVPTSVAPSEGGRTHPLIHPYAPTYAEMRDKTIAHAGAIKDVNPNALVFGGVGYGYAEFRDLQGASDRNSYPAVTHPGGDQAGELNYLEWLLKSVQTAEVAQGRKLMDVLDVHWYPEATGGGTRISFDNSASPSAALVEARVQAPRSLWDPTYTETSWITSCCSGGPIKLLKHLQRDVADFNPGTKLAMTEYNYGGGRHISGGVAQADVLGIFGKEDLFAATLWPIASGSQSQFQAGAFKMYLDYDGASGNGQFGDLSIAANTSNISQSAVYGSVDSDDPTRMTLVAINRTTSAKSVGLAVTHDRRFDLAEVYQLTAANANPVRVADVPINLVNAFQYIMPAMSVSTIVLRSFGDGDFDLNGLVNAADLTVWRSHVGMTAGARFADGDNDRDGDVDGTDFVAWQRALGGAALESAGASVPEPGSAGLAALGVMLLGLAARRRASGVAVAAGARLATR
ncbi:MAG TPA: glycoside hydrolase family 44 protein [Lacipirellulaceae bacterium]|nr:glycoside hydrolase family 44 protein [Lacipirellulaceae bacterium]